MAEKITMKRMEELLRALVSIESPYFHEEKAMDFAEQWLSEHNIPYEPHSYFEEKITGFHGRNVTGQIDSGKPGPVIFLGGHLDTVNLCSGWTKPPFEGVVEDGYMYGVGALDMKAGCAAIMLVLEDFVKEGKDFKGKIIYQFVSDEEGPMGLGTIALILDNKYNFAEETDFAVIAEPSAGFIGVPHPCLALGARGGYNYTIKVYGKSSHAATPRLGVSAAVDASKIVCELEKLEPMHDNKLGDSVPCVIRMQTAESACSVPDYAEIEIFHHTVRGETIPLMKQRLEDCIERAQIQGRAEIVFRESPAEGFDGGFVPYCTDEDNDYLKLLQGDIEKICGKKASEEYFQAIGDFNHIGGKLGIPTVLFGPDGNHFHGADERVNLQSAVEVAQALSAFLNDALTE